ncbi:TonB-dependent receptor [Shewanella avicenniae]|uniref:TonB-dependent receptor n=1 Tax=Shewanella avicenniae TaxID=2814294 RepID=A0ABX7QU00_9GAMM|nr:TonB-dependent receptor [Shewanella avicenniae]QSX34133.1 TonB-dependent receptor [Shewanella avicenniae]
MSTNKFKLSLVALAVLGINAPAAFAAEKDANIEVQAPQAPTAAAANDQKANAPKVKPDEHIVVTGSRLQYGNVVSKPTIITEQDIKERGVSSVEELIRTLPQNLATIGGMANSRVRGPLGVADGSPSNMSSIGALGVSAANLGGMGAGRTLILVNGRRMAGAAGIQDGFVNLNGIPLSAIERVEITTDGASAVYGADAMGGVINFILKSGYTGTTVTVQHEDSNNGADNSRFSVYSGYGWNSGTVSMTLDYSKRKPVINAKTGYVTNDYSAYYDGDENFDRRSFSNGGQPGIINNSTSYYDWDLDAYINTISAYTIRDGYAGGRPTMDDMVEVGREAIRDFVPRVGGPDTESKSVTLNFEQELTDKLKVYGTGLFTRNESSQDVIESDGISLTMAPGQYYNPFPEYYFSSWDPGVTAYYYPEDELASGQMPYGHSQNRSDTWSLNAGVSYEFNKDTKLEFIYTTSRATTKGATYDYDSIVSMISDSASPNGFRCYNFQLDYGRYAGAEQAFYQDLFDRQCAALTSNDPNIAFNPWKSTADGSGSGLDPFYYRHNSESRGSRLENYELRLNGALMELPAGKVYYAVGGEYNDDGIDSNEVKVMTGEAVHRTRNGFFAEASVPVFGHKLNFPGMNALTLSLAARRDSYSTEGALGTIDGVPVEQGGEILYGKNTFTRWTPSYGFKWEPISDVTVRAKWTEGFKAPPYTAMFNVTGTSSYTAYLTNDPYYDCRANADCDFDWGSSYGYYAPRTTAPNEKLKPQTSKQASYTVSWLPSGVLSGLTVDVTYNNTKIDNEYADLDDLNHYAPFEQTVALEDFYPRDENGKITAVRNMTFNMSGSEYSSLLYEVGYYLYTDFGSFKPHLTFIRNLKSETKLFADSDPMSDVGHLGGVDRYKMTGSLQYTYNNFSATLWAYYLPSYINDYEVQLSAGQEINPEKNKDVGSMTTFDLTMSYQLSNSLRVNFAGRNIFDRAPSFVVVEQLPYDVARYNVAGRTLSLELQYEF